jgi:hypothetical protein
VYVPVPIVHAGSKSMVYVCGSAWCTVVDLARDDIVVGMGSTSLCFNGKERSRLCLKHRYVACAFISHRVGAEALGNSQGLLYHSYHLHVSRHQHRSIYWRYDSVKRDGDRKVFSVVHEEPVYLHESYIPSTQVALPRNRITATRNNFTTPSVNQRRVYQIPKSPIPRRIKMPLCTKIAQNQMQVPQIRSRGPAPWLSNKSSK